MIGIPVKDSGELIFLIGIGFQKGLVFRYGSCIPDMDSNGLVIPILIGITDKDLNELDFLMIIGI